jgi:hypothetical protein
METHPLPIPLLHPAQKFRFEAIVVMNSCPHLDLTLTLGSGTGRRDKSKRPPIF